MEANDWKKKLKWDVTHTTALKQVEDQTFAFDPLLSYETTGYRPITDKLGKDFNPAPFMDTGKSQMTNGRYTTFIIGTKTHVDWWREEHRKCNDGVVFNNYRLTGDNYFFLNFYSMLIQDSTKKAGSGRDFIHPSFWAAHYEWFHYIELAETFGYDCVGLKSRGVGFSEIGASLGVRPYTTVPYYSTLYIASYEPYLTGKGIVQKCWNQLHWLNQNTEGGMRRVRSIDQDLHKKAAKLNAQREETGHQSQISGQVVDKPDKLRGDRTERIIFEESGSNPSLLNTYAVSEALVIPNGERIGIRIVFGTGGDTETGEGRRTSVSGLHGLEKLFLSPRTYGILPYRHNYNNTNTFVETGYFVPAWRTVKRALDERGVANEQAGKDYYIKTRRIPLQKDPIMYLKHCAEYCFTYEEALSSKGSNRFNQGKLADQRIEIEILKSTPLPVKGHLKWTYIPNTNKVNGVKFTPHVDGTVEITEEPIVDNNTMRAIKDLYVGGIDSIDVGADESIVGSDGSKFAIVIKKRSYGLSGNQYVCKYMDRPKDVREAYEKAMMILYWYGCVANLEATRVGLIAHFREKGMITYLMKRPKYALEGQSANRNLTSLIGTQASPKMIEYGLDLIRDYIEDYAHTMLFPEMVVQCIEYSDEMKGKYDIVAAMQMCEIGDQELMGIVPKEEEPEEIGDVGYYRDEKGYKRWGVVPNKQEDYANHLF